MFFILEIAPNFLQPTLFLGSGYHLAAHCCSAIYLERLIASESPNLNRL